MAKKKKKKKYTTYYIIIFVILMCFFVFLYDRLGFVRVKDSYDIKTSHAYESIPKDILIKEYKEYKQVLKEYLDIKEYNEKIKSSIINEESFKKYDYVVLFYEVKSCSGSGNYSKKLSQYTNRIVLSVVRKEEKDCGNIMGISFIPVEKKLYDKVPNIVVEKKNIKK